MNKDQGTEVPTSAKDLEEAGSTSEPTSSEIIEEIKVFEEDVSPRKRSRYSESETSINQPEPSQERRESEGTSSKYVEEEQGGEKPTTTQEQGARVQEVTSGNVSIRDSAIGQVIINEHHHHHQRFTTVLQHKYEHVGVSSFLQVSEHREVLALSKPEGTSIQPKPATSQSGDPSTSGDTGQNEDKNQAIQSRKVLTDNDGVHTEFKNLLGGRMSISKTKQIEIDPVGRVVKIAECCATFRQGCFKAKTLVTMTVEIDSTKWERKFIGYTPTLYIDAPGLLNDVHVRLPSWCIGELGSSATLWHKATENDSWEATDVPVKFTDNSYLEFERRIFSRTVVGGQDNEVQFRIAGGIYVSKQNELTVGLHLDDRSDSRRMGMAAEWLAAAINRLEPPRRFKTGLKTIRTIRDQTIGVLIACVPETVKPVPQGPYRTNVDDDFLFDGYEIHNTTLMGTPRTPQNVTVLYHVYKSELFHKRGSFSHIFTPSRIQLPAEPYRAPAIQPATNMNLITVGDTTEVDRRRQTAQQIVERGARARNSSRNNRTRIQVEQSQIDETSEQNEPSEENEP